MLSGHHWLILEAVRAGASLDEIEHELIARAKVDEDEKAALWLLAQALRDLGADRREPALLGPDRSQLRRASSRRTQTGSARRPTLEIADHI